MGSVMGTCCPGEQKAEMTTTDEPVGRVGRGDGDYSPPEKGYGSEKDEGDELQPVNRDRKVNRLCTKTLDEQKKIDDRRNQGKRGGISAERIQDSAVSNFVKPVHPKGPTEEAFIKKILKENQKLQVLVGHLTEAAVQDVVNAFFLKEVSIGVDVIRQGDEGDCLYICETGSLEIFVKRPGAEDGGKGQQVLTVGPEAMFGELALLYKAPRAATVTVASPTAKLWAIEQEPFQILVRKGQREAYEGYDGWMKEVKILQVLNNYEFEELVEKVEAMLYDADEEIIIQGEPGDKFFIVEDGECAAFITGDRGEVQVKEYRTGDYFGEIACLTGQARAATVRGTGDGCAVVSIDKEDLLNLLSPVADSLRQEIAKYPPYKDFCK